MGTVGQDITFNYLFYMYKDKPITNKDNFVHTLKGFNKQIDLRALYTKIVNYQIEKYGNTIRFGFDRIPKKKVKKIGRV